MMPGKRLTEDGHEFPVVFLGELKKEIKNDKRYYSTGFFIISAQETRDFSHERNAPFLFAY